MKARLFVLLQYLLPHHLLCRLMYALTRVRLRPVKDACIRAFIRRYRPQLAEALEPDPAGYPSFNAFFTRELRPGARPLDPDPRRVLSPCDGLLSIAAELHQDTLLQAKGHRYSLAALVADEGCAALLQGGSYATLYLAPRDYHRVHMPLDGRLLAAWHIAGRLFSVNAVTAARVPRLFARNERVVCLFEGSAGRFAVILIGALFVGSIDTVWHGAVTPWRGGAATGAGGLHRLEPRTSAAPWQPRGAELGRFNMGSTVILLLPAGHARWDERCQPGALVRVGQGLGTLQTHAATGVPLPEA